MVSCLVIFRYLLLSAFFLVQGCTNLSTFSNRQAMQQLMITEPLPVNYKHEVAIASLSQAILRADVSNAQRAEFYYQRGTYYDKVGLRTLAFFDFKHALTLKPDLVEAYNFIGIHFTQLQQFTQAFDAFDSALDLDPEHEYAYLNRGIALYFADRPSLAKEDLLAFLNKQPKDPYRVIWLYFAEQAMNDPQAMQNLSMRRAALPNNVWGIHIVDLFLGYLPEEKLLALVSNNVNDHKELIEKLCEAYFYLGKLNEINGNKPVAENYFKLALATKVYEFVEHRYAKLALDLINETQVETQSN